MPPKDMEAYSRWARVKYWTGTVKKSSSFKGKLEGKDGCVTASLNDECTLSFKLEKKELDDSSLLYYEGVITNIEGSINQEWQEVAGQFRMSGKNVGGSPKEPLPVRLTILPDEGMYEFDIPEPLLVVEKTSEMMGSGTCEEGTYLFRNPENVKLDLDLLDKNASGNAFEALAKMYKHPLPSDVSTLSGSLEGSNTSADLMFFSPFTGYDIPELVSWELSPEEGPLVDLKYEVVKKDMKAYHGSLLSFQGVVGIPVLAVSPDFTAPEQISVHGNNRVKLMKGGKDISPDYKIFRRWRIWDAAIDPETMKRAGPYVSALKKFTSDTDAAGKIGKPWIDCPGTMFSTRVDKGSRMLMEFLVGADGHEEYGGLYFIVILDTAPDRFRVQMYDAVSFNPGEWSRMISEKNLQRLEQASKPYRDEGSMRLLYDSSKSKTKDADFSTYAIMNRQLPPAMEIPPE